MYCHLCPSHYSLRLHYFVFRFTLFCLLPCWCDYPFRSCPVIPSFAKFSTTNCPTNPLHYTSTGRHHTLKLLSLQSSTSPWYFSFFLSCTSSNLSSHITVNSNMATCLVEVDHSTMSGLYAVSVISAGMLLSLECPLASDSLIMRTEFHQRLLCLLLMSQMQIQLWKFVLHPPRFELESFGLRDQCSTEWAKGVHSLQYQATGLHKHLWRIPSPQGISSSRLEVQSNFDKFDKECFCNTKKHRIHYGCQVSQMQIQLWKIDLHPPGFELGSFGLRDQCSTEWANRDSLQSSQYQVTGSNKHLWHWLALPYKVDKCNTFPQISLSPSSFQSI